MDYKFRTKPYKHQENIFNKIKDISNNIGFSEQHTRRTLRHLFSEELIVRQDQKKK